MTFWTLLAMMGAFALGACLQRIAGMGLALVAAPILSLLLGPVAGISVGNVGSIFSSALLMVQLRRDIDWSRYLRIGPLIVGGAIPGALLVRSVQPSWLDVIVGALVLLGMLTTYLLRNGSPLTGPVPAMSAGLIAGFMNTTAGVSGPAMAVYGLASHWEQRSFAATIQPVFLTAGACSVIMKSLFGATTVTQLLPWWGWPAVAVAIVIGVLAGGRLAGRFGVRQARRLTIAVATVGALVTLVRGLTAD